MFFYGQTDVSPMLDSLSLSSVTGVVAATLFCVEIIKRSLKGVSWFEKVPTFLYAILIAAGLSFLANKLGWLVGNPLLVVWSSVISAMGSSGFYTWLRNPEPVQTSSVMGDGGTLEGSSQNHGVIPVLVALVFLATGCVSGEKRAANDSPVANSSRLIYASVLKELTIARQAGLINDSEKAQIDVIRKDIVVALDKMEEAEIAGLTFNKATFNTLLDKLIEWRTKANQRRISWIESYIQQNLAFYSGVRDAAMPMEFGRDIQMTSPNLSGNGMAILKFQPSPHQS